MIYKDMRARFSLVLWRVFEPGGQSPDLSVQARNQPSESLSHTQSDSRTATILPNPKQITRELFMCSS